MGEARTRRDAGIEPRGNGRVAIGYCSDGRPDFLFHQSLVHLLLTRPGLITTDIGLLSGPRIASARNTIVREFLANGDDEWLWMVDTDMVFDSTVLDQLLLTAANVQLRDGVIPVVGGLCFGGGRDGRLFPTLYQIVDPDTNDGEAVRRLNDYPRDAVVRVDATGAACLLMHRSILLAMGERFGYFDDNGTRRVFSAPWFMESLYRGKEFGEDYTFCLRLMQMDVPLYVNTKVKLGHSKRRVIGEDEYLAYRASNTGAAE